MSRRAVSCLDGVFCIVQADGTTRPIRLGGQPVRSFTAGWLPRGACDSFAPWTVLDLVHHSGLEAAWLLDAGLDYVPVPIEALAEADRAAFIRIAAPVLSAAHRCLLRDSHPSMPAELGPGPSPFDGLNRGSLATIVALACEPALGATRLVDLYHAPPDPEGYVVGAPERPLRLRAVLATLGGNLQEQIEQALLDGALRCASPVDGQMLSSTDSLVLHEHRTAYRFVDTRHDLVFFVSATDFLFDHADLFIPDGLVVFRPHPADGTLPRLVADFLSHVIAEAPALLAYLADPQHPVALATRGYPEMHMGHQLWNELSAIERVVRRVPEGRLPVVIVPNAATGSEAYAPMERIFPELAQRVDRGLRDPEALGAYVYRQRYCLFRALDEHVTQTLGRRLREAAAGDPPLPDDARLAARIRDGRLPCILFGLRVENRTAVDPLALVADAIEHLRQRLGRLVVVIDGHNSRLHHDPVTLYQSYGQGQSEPPIFAELHLVLALHRQFDGTGVEILNLCGASMSRSLYWSERSDFFVAFWGAALAKYRWACNRPGLVLSSRWNLTHRSDLDIYHAPRYLEDAAPISFIDPDAVVDLPDAPVRFSPVHPVPTYSNFRVDPAMLRTALDGMIAQHLP